MSNVILLNAFEVPDGATDASTAYWEEGADLMRKAPGYVSTALHRAIDDNARFQLINRAEWTSPEAFYAAVQAPEFTAFTERHKGDFTYFPGLYRVIRSDVD